MGLIVFYSNEQLFWGFHRIMEENYYDKYIQIKSEYFSGEIFFVAFTPSSFVVGSALYIQLT